MCMLFQQWPSHYTHSHLEAAKYNRSLRLLATEQLQCRSWASNALLNREVYSSCWERKKNITSSLSPPTFSQLVQGFKPAHFRSHNHVFLALVNCLQLHMHQCVALQLLVSTVVCFLKRWITDLVTMLSAALKKAHQVLTFRQITLTYSLTDRGQVPNFYYETIADRVREWGRESKGAEESEIVREREDHVSTRAYSKLLLKGRLLWRLSAFVYAYSMCMHETACVCNFKISKEM